jgi:8-oxo-dGTP pyrophosphatase MutT (NUDIX family)
MIPQNGRGGPQIIPRPPTAELGGDPPWNHLQGDERQVDLARLVRRLRTFTPQFAERGLPATGKTSAVLVPLYIEDDEPIVLLTRRSPTLRAHTHEVAFPGGRHDPDDADHVATALREAHEEINLPPDQVEIVGSLDWFVTGGSGSLVHPYVGLLPGAPVGLRPNPGEVEAILPVPLRELLLDETWREEIWERDGLRWPVSFFELYGDTIWGATANMLRQLLTIATDPG